MANGSAIQVILKGSAWSTPKSDTTPAQLVGNELETALRLMQAEAAAFAESVIKDPAARAEYTKQTKAACDELIERVKQRRITPHEAAKTANAMRNQIMELARARLTDFGLTYSKDIKDGGRPLSYMQDRKANQLFAKSFDALTSGEKERVWCAIVESAGQSNGKVNLKVRLYGLAGRTFLVATLAFSVYNVATADDKPRQTAKEGATIIGGVTGSAGAVAGVVFVASNPAGWVVGAAMFVGAALGAVGASSAFEYFWPESTP